jgi:hypothetical protein
VTAESDVSAHRKTSYVRQIDRLLLGKAGIVVVSVLAFAGQFVWLARALGAISLADAVAIEGIIVAVAFGILAVRVALRHEVELRSVSGSLGGVSETLGNVSRRLEGVSKSVQTQPIGEFPDFLPRVTELIARAEKSIVIMCDAPGYAIYSNGPEFDAYAAAVKNKIASRAENPAFAVDLMFFADREREQVQRHQTARYVTTETEWNTWRDSPEARDQLRAFLKRAARVCDPEAREANESDLARQLDGLTIDGFIQHFDTVDEVLLEHHFYGANRRVLMFRDSLAKPQVPTHGPSIYFWMRDDLEAVFAVVPMGDRLGESREVAFQTHDPAMIDALRGIFSRYQRASVPFASRSAMAG